MILGLLLLLLIIVFSIPAVQTWTAKKVTENLNESFGVDINIQRIGLNWKAEVDIREVFIADHHKDTLIYSRELQTNILSFSQLIKGKLGFGSVALQDVKLFIKTYKDEDINALTVFSQKFDSAEESTSPFNLFSNDVVMKNGRLKVINQNLDDPNVFGATSLDLTANQFTINGPDIHANIQKLSGIIDWGMVVEDLHAEFEYSPTRMHLQNLSLETIDSKITGDILFEYGEEKGMSDFADDVMITADIIKSKIASNDLNVFYNEFGPDQQVFLDAFAHGTLNDFAIEKTQLITSETNIIGDFHIMNLLDPEKEIYIVANSHNVLTNYYDLRRFMPKVLGAVIPIELKSLGNITYIGNSSFIGDKLQTNSNLFSSIGKAKIDLSMSNINNIEHALYKGHVVLRDFHLGKIVKTSSLGRVSADLDFDGRGFNINTVDTEISGKISSLEFEKYPYKNIEVSGNLKNPLFDGKLSIDDPNLKLKFSGLIDASGEVNHLDFRADVEFSDLNKLNLITRDSIAVFTGNVVVDMDGSTIDDVIGTISFTETFYQNEREYYYFDDFKVTSSFSDQVRVIEINSPDIMNGRISGEFLIKDIPNLFQNGIASNYANYIPQEVTTNQYIDYQFEIYNKIIDVFIPQLKFGDNTRVKGSVSSDESKFKLDFRSPEILVFKNYIGKLNIQIDNDNPLYNVFIDADSVDMGFYNLKDINVINKTLNDTMYVRAEFKGGDKKNDLFNLSLFHTINAMGKSVVGMKKSDITYKENVWYLNEKNDRLNKVVFDDNFNEIRIDSLVLSHNEERIRMAGVLRDSTYKDIRIRFEDVNIGNITPDIDSLRMQGNVNGRFDLIQKDGSYFPNSLVTVDGVVLNDIPFGDLNLEIDGNEDLTKYNINTWLINDNVKSINAVGQIDVSTKYPQIQLNVDLNQFNIQAFSPFGGDVISEMRGLITGSARVSGNYNSPDIQGRFGLENTGLKVPYLNTDFDIDNDTQILVSKGKLEIQRTGITDTKYKSTGFLSGYATHNNFSKWELNLRIDADDHLLVLDTPPDEDELYYGTAFISGLATIIGPIDELTIRVDATTEKNTSFKIPISTTESIGDDSFVHFLSPEEKRARLEGDITEFEERKKLSLEFDLNINNNAEVEVVVDKVNNSTLKGRGSGTLLLRIDTAGKFLMYGDFVVYRGEFDFRYAGIIQRNIEVVPGGNIIWDGAPERADLDISARYITEANPSVLLDNPSVNRKIPVEVYVDLSGQLTQPDLTFDIRFPRVSSTLKSELEYKLQTEEQKQNQALFLLASNSFVDDNYGGSNAFAGTLADRVSGLVNDLFADQDGKFKVGLDYSVGTRTPDQETSDRFGITLSTQINERILINGKVGVPVGGVNETAVAGDIEVQWLVNEDGSLRINFFNRQADLQFIGEDQIFEQGAGISYSVDFNTFRELIRKLFNKNLTLESELPVIPDDNSFPVDFNPQGTLPENE